MEAAPRRMPWRRVLSILVLLIAPAAAAGSLDGYAVGGLLFFAAAGVLCGLVGGVFGHVAPALLAPFLAWGAAALIHPPWPGIDPRLIALGLAVLAGLEAWRSGGRAMTLAIIPAMLLHGATQAPPWDPLSAAVFAGSAALGLGGVWLAGGLGSRAPGPVAPLEAMTLTLFLAIGLFLTITLSQTVHRPEAIWLILMFVFRALVPPKAAYIAHLRFAVGAVLGAAVAGLLAAGVLTPLGLSGNHAVRGAVGILAIATGLRFMPARNLAPPLCFSVGAVTLINPSTTIALIRGEDALGIAVLAMALSFVLDWALNPRPARTAAR